jgi:hypothetical protein
MPPPLAAAVRSQPPLPGQTFPFSVVKYAGMLEEQGNRVLDYCRMRTTRVGLYSTVLPGAIEDSLKVLLPPLLTEPDPHVLDLTACIGGDVCLMAAHWPVVRGHAIELHDDTFDVLRYNVDALGLGGRVTTQLGNSVAAIEQLAADGPEYKYTLVYADPPWGGPEVWKTPPGETIMLYVIGPHGDQVSLTDLTRRVFDLKLTRRFVAKTTPNFDLDAYKGGMPPGATIETAVIYKTPPTDRRPRKVAYHLQVVTLDGTDPSPTATSCREVEALLDALGL